MHALAAALLAAQAAPVEDWWYFSVLGEAGAQQAFYIDRASIRREGVMATVEEAREAERTDEQGIIGARNLVRYDCRARTWQVLRYTFLLADGRRHVARLTMTTPEAVSEGAIADDALHIACGEREGIERLGTLAVREQALLLFAERAATLRASPAARP